MTLTDWFLIKHSALSTQESVWAAEMQAEAEAGTAFVRRSQEQVRSLYRHLDSASTISKLDTPTVGRCDESRAGEELGAER